MEEQTIKQEGSEQEQTNKTEKKFNSILSKLVAVVGGKENLKVPNKVPKNELGNLVQELFKEEGETTIKESKEKLRNLLKAYAEMERAISNKRKELDKLEKEKKEEFSKAAEELFNKIEDIGEVEKLYYKGMKDAVA